MIGRRGFLGMAAAFALDPERALYVPGRKLISIARPRPRRAILHGVEVWGKLYPLHKPEPFDEVQVRYTRDADKRESSAELLLDGRRYGAFTCSDEYAVNAGKPFPPRWVTCWTLQPGVEVWGKLYPLHKPEPFDEVQVRYTRDADKRESSAELLLDGRRYGVFTCSDESAENAGKPFPPRWVTCWTLQPAWTLLSE